MARRLVLPLASPASAAQRPTVEVVRKRLGGRASTEPGAGEVLTLQGSRGERTGVVLFARGEELDVWLDHDMVHRVRRTETRPADGVVAPELLEVARDALAFAALREGQRVGFRHEGGGGEGTLVEKCRFGGLVELRDRAIIGVGFRRLSSSEGESEQGPTSP